MPKKVTIGNILFEPIQLGRAQLPNRFVRSATYEAMVSPDGSVTPRLVKAYGILGKGQLGAIISSIAYVSPEGRNAPLALAIDRDDVVEGLAEAIAAAQAGGSVFFMQLAHAGGQTSKRFMHRRPLAPSSHFRDPSYLEKPAALNGRQIASIIGDFAAAAARATQAGADGVQIHGAHGYLIAEFLSPFFNRRSDEWGGSAHNRFRFLREVILAVRERVGDDVPVLVKIVHDDGTPEPGMTAELAADYAARLSELGIAALELSAGATSWAPFQMCRGDVPIEEFARPYPWLLRPLVRRRLRAMVDDAAFEPNYNAAAARVVKPALGQVPLILVGGLRRLAAMQDLVAHGTADLISMSRPLVRQPKLVQRFAQGKDDVAACISCNRCFAAVANNLPIRCYVKGVPESRPAGVRAS